MKKILCAVFLLLHSVAAFGEYDFDLAYKKWEKFSENVLSFAGRIVANNKPAYEHKLTRKERYYNGDMFDMFGKGNSPVMWLRVWAKHKTIVTAWATSNKRFEADHFETVDPNFVFLNGIHVGSSIRDLERYFGTSLSNVNESSKPGVIYGSSQSEGGFMVLVTHNKGIITKIAVSMLYWAGGFPVPNSEKVELYITSARKKLGIPESPAPFDYN